MIKALELTKIFGRTRAVDNLSFEVAPGEIVGFLGPNGAGKTTTMRILSCFLPPTRGTVTIGGLDIVRDSLEVRRIIGYLPETVPLYGEMRVNEYLHFRAKLKGLRGLRRRNRVNDVLEQCGLESVSHYVIGRLSKGYRQRVGLADSLVHEPQLLILDEPTIGLDPNQIRHVRDLIRNVGGKQTVLLSTHILSEVEAVCDRALIMHEGRIVASDSPDSLVSGLHSDISLQAEIGGPLDEVLAAIRALPGVLRASGDSRGEWNQITIDCGADSDVRASLFTMVSSRGWLLRELRTGAGRNLEDVFVRMTAGSNSP